MKYKALFLDFYGTLVQEDDAIIDRIVRLIASESPEECTPADVVKSWHFADLCLQSFGESFKTQRDLELESLRALLDRYRVTLDPHKLSSELFAYWRRPEAYDTAGSFLQQAALPVCIVSNIDDDDLDSALQHNGWQFQAVVTSEQVRAYKPRPEPYQAALAKMAVRPEEAIHIGDSLRVDVAGAKALGIDTIWVNRNRRTLPQDAKRPTHVISRLDEAIRFLE